MPLSRSEKRAARNFARNFAAGLVQNTEIGVLDPDLVGLNDDQVTEAQAEMVRIAKRLQATVALDD